MNNRNLNIIAYKKVKSLIEFLEAHETLSAGKCQVIIDEVNRIWAKINPRRDEGDA